MPDSLDTLAERVREAQDALFMDQMWINGDLLDALIAAAEALGAARERQRVREAVAALETDDTGRGTCLGYHATLAAIDTPSETPE